MEVCTPRRCGALPLLNADTKGCTLIAHANHRVPPFSAGRLAQNQAPLQLGPALWRAWRSQRRACQATAGRSRQAAKAVCGAALTRSTEWQPSGQRSRGRRLRAATAAGGAALTRSTAWRRPWRPKRRAVALCSASCRRRRLPGRARMPRCTRYRSRWHPPLPNWRGRSRRCWGGSAPRPRASWRLCWGWAARCLPPPPATPRPANEATTVARRLGALSPDPASTHAPLTASPAVQPASKAGSPRPGSAAQPAAAPVLRSSAPPEASAPRQLLTHVAGSSSINGRGGSPRVHLRGSQLWPEGPGRGGDQEVPPPFSPDPGLHTGLSTSRGSAAAQAGLRTSPRGSTRTAGGGQNGRLAQPAAAAPPSRLFTHAVSSPFPTDEADGKSAAQHAARHAPSSPGSATSRQVAQEGQAEGPGTPWRRVGLLSAAARLLRP